MLLDNKFYRIVSEKRDGNNAVFKVAILPDCDVYQGHFPGDPVCPGVCNIETIKECVQRLLGHDVTMTAIKQCRLTAIATPTVCPEVDINIQTTPAANGYYTILADIKDNNQTYMEFKGTMV